ncbi:MAG: bifunctional lysylphosphatidylglycerol flippase/synthetase MprF [Acidobacteria bacterium]|nr:bifunctional lysylphosphatidylglycerol flippase/synthetase MprF [Acidobacteriota bacterium]
MTAAERARAALPALIGLVLFLASLAVLRAELRAMTWHGLVAAVTSTSPWRVAFAILLTAASYVVLTGYDFLAFAYLGKRLPARRIAATSLLAYAVSNNVGFGMLSGASIRYRFYTRWGVSTEELSRIVFSYIATFWLGLLFLGGLSLALSPLPRALGFPPPWLIAPVGWLLVLASLGYLAAAALRLGPLSVRRFELPLPPVRLALAQLAVSIVDWTMAATVLYVLLPGDRAPYLAVLAAFLASQFLGLASHVPGGMGVFEGLMTLLLKPFIASIDLLPALIVYRAVYYLLPLAVAAVGLVADELRQRRSQAARLSATLGWLTEELTPRVLAAITFLAGVVLLASGATPAAPGRLRFLDRLLPLGVIELSHFAGSVLGAALLLLSQGLARRLDAAYVLTATALAAGIAASLLKGADYEEAAVLAATLLVLWRARPAFDRRAALFETRFSPGWITAVAAAISGSLWLGLFAFKHVEYSRDLWWQFELHGEASRMLRASVGAGVTVLLFGLARLIGYAPHEAPAPSADDLSAAAAIIASQTATLPNLVFLRDKALLFDDEKKAFVMYAVQGRTFAALGDPVGPPDRVGAMVRLFVERCDDFGGVPAFYEVSNQHLARYADMGLTFIKLGEDARVDLAAFSIDGSSGRTHRHAVNRLAREQGVFRVIPADGVAAVMEQLRAISDDWLEHHAGAEKGFSLGFFDPEYVARFPVAVVERDGRIVAFATVWLGAGGVECSTDLMRYGRSAPKDVMDALFAHLLLWAKGQGCHWFELGMAPLSGIEQSAGAPFWNRVASFLYAHGEAIYNFRGLRAFKERFDPVWEPRYLVYPGGFRLPLVLADISALVAGGYRRIFLK